MMMVQRNYTPIEITIMAHQQIVHQANSTVQEMQTTTPSLKRQLDAQKRINHIQPLPDTLNKLIQTFISPKSRWLEIERDAISFEAVAQLDPSIYVCVSKEMQKLVLHNCMYSLCNTINASKPDVRFIQEDMSLALSKEATQLQFDLITSVLSLYRFFKNEESARHLFSNVASCLSQDGRFVCVFRSGSELLPHEEEERRPVKKSRMYDPLEESGQDSLSILKSLLQIVKKKPQVYASFGSSLPEGVNLHQESEVLVFRNVVLGIAKSCGLVPIVDYPQELINTCFEPTDVKAPFKHFRDTCYGSIVFKKKPEKIISVL